MGALEWLCALGIVLLLVAIAWTVWVTKKKGGAPPSVVASVKLSAHSPPENGRQAEPR